MGARRTVLCPRCRAPRVTKAVGRTRLSCTGCGSTWLARDAEEQPAPEPAASAPESADLPSPAPIAHAADGDPAATATPTTTGTAGIGAVNVLEADVLRIDPPSLAFPEPAPAPPGGQPAPPAPALPVPPPASESAPVSAAPGRRLGYYGRVGRRG